MKRDEYCNHYVSEDIRQKALLSRQEVEDMLSRPIYCPHCNYVMAYAYKDMTGGHFDLKCPRCKQISVFNLGYFYHDKEPKRIYGQYNPLPPFIDIYDFNKDFDDTADYDYMDRNTYDEIIKRLNGDSDPAEFPSTEEIVNMILNPPEDRK